MTACAFATAMLVMLLVGWSYQSNIKTMQIAHKNEIASLKRSNTIELKRRDTTDERLRDINRSIDLRCGR